MELKIGNKIKSLRKKQKITQEQLAERIGVSFQAVSKWENDIALPDITLVPVIAQYFGISTDELLSFDSSEKDKEIEQLVYESYKLRETNPEDGKKILEEGLKKYPDNDILLNNMLYVMNYSKNPDETISLASKLIDKTSNHEVRYDALRFLAYAYNAKGDAEGAKSALEQIPEIYFTKLSEMAFILTGEPKYNAAEKQKWISFEILLQMMWKIAEFYIDKGEKDKAINETQRALRLISAMDGDEKIERFDNYIEFFTKQISKIID
ncbi:MAG: helix-turn-helix transcriptional regulator [Ruminococcaceae bacterium]|nr:helix-turn-helix transcriptional regulator [Oscillospiraceae bacterium]